MFLDNFPVLSSVLLITCTILPVVNPLADAPIFLQLTPGSDKATRAYLAKRIAFYSFFILLASLLFGSFVLKIFGISIPLVQLGGGAVLCGLAWNVSSSPSKSSDIIVDPAHAKLIALGRVITPLTLPLTVDAGSIAVAITVGSTHPNSIENVVVNLISAIFGSAIIAWSIWLCYKYADFIGEKLGEAMTKIMTNLASFLLLCIGLGICWSGIQGLLHQIGIPA